MKTLHYSTLVTLAGLGIVLAGCGGGATQAPTITVKPKASKSTVANIEKTGKKTGNNTTPDTGGVGDLVGVIKYNGAAPAVGKPKGFDPTDPKTDKYCVGVAGKITDETLLVDAATKGLANVIIYLPKKPKGYSEAAPQAAVLFDQKNCQFLPHVLPVRTGQTVKLLNSDMTTHNTHTYPTRNPGYSQALPFGKTDTIVYNAAETIPVKVGCDIHGWMSAVHMPLDHHFVAVTDKQGNFSIKGLPTGTYRFRIWHEKAGTLEREYEMTIKPGKNNMDLTFESAKFATFTGPKPKTIILSSLN